MTELTRRGFVTRSAATAAGMAALGTLAVDQGEAEAQASDGSHPVVAYVRDARRGEVSLMSGEREVTVRDRKLAAHITRAAS